MNEQSKQYIAQDKMESLKRQKYIRQAQSGKLDRNPPDLNAFRFSQEAEDRRMRRLASLDGQQEKEMPVLSAEPSPPPPIIATETAPKPVSGRRYTSAELDAMEAQAVEQGMNPQAAKEAADTMSGGIEDTENFMGGFGASLKRTVLGLKQAYQYMAGDDAGREAVNRAIQKLEEHPALQTPSGKAGEITGTAAQFAGPQGMGSLAAKAAPKAIVKGIQAVTGQPGSVGRTAIQGGAFEAAQPVEVADADTGEYLMGKGANIAKGTTLGAVTGQVGKVITSPGVPVSAERAGVAAEAKRLGIELTPAQRTGDVTLSQFEEGLASRPGSAKIILDAREAQQAVLNKKATEALGVGAKYSAPHEAALAEAHSMAAKGYEPVAQIPSMSWDVTYMTDLDKFIAKQNTKAVGSPDAAAIAGRLKKGNKKWTGSDFLEEMQGVRDMSFGARQKGDVATAKQLGDLAEILENYATRRVEKLAKLGQIPADAMDNLREARTLYAKIHAIEKATEPVSGKVSALKYLTQEFKRNPASKGPSQSPVATGLKEVGDTARVLKQVTPYIGSSGTAERIAGQQLVDATQGPFAALRASGPIAKNWLAAKYYMAQGGKPGILGNRLPPEQNLMVRRLMPDIAFGAKEGVD